MTPLQEILLISIGLSVFSAILYRVLTKPEEVKRVKEEVKGFREKIKEAQKAGKNDEASKLMSEMMKANQKQLKGNMKPMFVSMIVFIATIAFLRETYATFILNLPVAIPLLSYSFPFIIIRDTIGWFWWYILITIPLTFAFRKFLGVE